jgi:hypothetical protein
MALPWGDLANESQPHFFMFPHPTGILRVRNEAYLFERIPPCEDATEDTILNECSADTTGIIVTPGQTRTRVAAVETHVGGKNRFRKPANRDCRRNLQT